MPLEKLSIVVSYWDICKTLGVGKTPTPKNKVYILPPGKLGFKRCRIPGLILAHVTRVNVKASSINRKSSLSINCTLLEIMCGIELSFVKSMSSTLQPRDSKELTVLELSVLLLDDFVHVSSRNNF